MATLDSILNFLVPTLLILIFIGFIWMKTPLGAWLGPHLQNLWLWMKGESQNVHIHREKVIAYE